MKNAHAEANLNINGVVEMYKRSTEKNQCEIVFSEFKTCLYFFLQITSY